MVGTHGFGDGLRQYQLFGQPGEHPLLDHGAADRAIVAAGAAPMMVEPAESIIHDDPIFAPAAPAGERAGEQENRAAGPVEAFGAGFAHTDGGGCKHLGELGLPRLDALPQRVIDDTQLRHLGPDPFRFGIAA
jgi:hypothetical protein